MRASLIQREHLKAFCMLILGFSILLLLSSCQAFNVKNTSASDMINSISNQLPNLMRLVTAVAYVLGMYLVITAIMKFKQFGEARTAMTPEHGLKEPFVILFVGSALLYLPSSVQVGLATFWTDPNPYSYPQTGDQWTLLLKSCFQIVQLIGTIAFIRGLVILTHSGNSQQGGFAKAVTHIVGGIFCINIYQFSQVMLATLGLQG